MRVLMVSLDRKVFVTGDSARARLAGYGTVFEELHIIVYAKRSLGLAHERIADNVWIYPTNSFSRLTYILDAVRIASEIGKKVSCSIVSGQDVGETGLSAWLIARTLKVPLQLQDHADVFDPYFARESIGNRMRVLLAHFLLPKADCIRTVLPKGKERIEKRYPRLSSRISILPVYTDTEQCKNAHRTFDLHDRYPQFSCVMLMASRLVPQKDIAFALTAFARANVPGSGLVIVGEGRCIESLMAKTEALGIKEQVVFVPWEKDLLSYYLSADLFLLSSRYESYCRTLVEAVAAGLPFVSTDVGVARLLMDAGAQGTVLAHDDLEGFALALEDARTRSKGDAGQGLQAVEALVGRDEAEYRARYRMTLEGCALKT